MRSLKYPVFTTSALSPGSVRLQTAISIAKVPPPATTIGCEVGAAPQTVRMRSRAEPKCSINAGDTWDVGAPEAASSTAGEISIGPGIMSSTGASRRQRP